MNFACVGGVRGTPCSSHVPPALRSRVCHTPKSLVSQTDPPLKGGVPGGPRGGPGGQIGLRRPKSVKFGPPRANFRPPEGVFLVKNCKIDGILRKKGSKNVQKTVKFDEFWSNLAKNSEKMAKSGVF